MGLYVQTAALKPSTIAQHPRQILGQVILALLLEGIGVVFQDNGAQINLYVKTKIVADAPTFGFHSLMIKSSSKQNVQFTNKKRVPTRHPFLSNLSRKITSQIKSL